MFFGVVLALRFFGHAVNRLAWYESLVPGQVAKIQKKKRLFVFFSFCQTYDFIIYHRAPKCYRSCLRMEGSRERLFFLGVLER